MARTGASFASNLILLPDCDSSRPSSVAEDDDFKRLSAHGFLTQDSMSGSSVKRMSSSAGEVIRKYLKKVKPLYEKPSQKKQCQ
ncbi:hypothetical protein PVL29_011997 [Vitis rotundifolia]|uniref:Uncharacterized protein n=1 Tax=Vitis rotundifolia TaxID=103349 RepID=A0AA39DRJ5_VITRO|nr:hypothetical protein PVL29_011997 [Vitis rotundifolia]